MTVYGDTSWWVAYKVTSDVNHSLARSGIRSISGNSNRLDTLAAR
jgi:hypothetical protein